MNAVLVPCGHSHFLPHIHLEQAIFPETSLHAQGVHPAPSSTLQKIDLSADAKRNGPPHILLRVYLIFESISTYARSRSGVARSHRLLSITEHGGSLGDGSGDRVKFIAAEWVREYSALSCPWNLLVRGKEYFCLDEERLRECLEASRSAIVLQ